MNKITYPKPASLIRFLGTTNSSFIVFDILQNANPNRMPPASLDNVKISVRTIAKVIGSIEIRGANSRRTDASQGHLGRYFIYPSYN